MNGAVKKHVVVIGAYVALTLIMTLPLISVFASHVAGSGGDPWQTMWRFEEKEVLMRATGDRQELAREFFGGGEARLVNLSVWPWMPLQMLFGQPAAYNIVWLLSFVLSGYGMYLLTSWLFTQAGSASAKASPFAKASEDKSVGRPVALIGEAPAFLIGVAYMFLPYHVAQAQGHFGAMQMQWLPLIVLALGAVVLRPNIWKVLGLAALITVQAWSEHHYMLWLSLLGLVAAGFFWGELKSFWFNRSGAVWTSVLVSLLLFFVVLPYRPTIGLATQGGSALELGVEQTVRFSADPFAYVTPAPFHPIWGGLATLLFAQNFTGNVAEATHYLGLLPLLLVLFFHRSIPRRQKAFWLTAAVFFVVISFGPRLHILGRVTALALPYDLLDQLPIFSSIRAVARASALVALSWLVLLAWVFKSQVSRGRTIIAILVIILLEFLFVPVSLQSAALPGVYEVIRDAPGTVLVEIPAATNYVAASRALYASRLHGKPVVGNIALERALDDEALTEARSLPVLRQLLYLRTTHLLEDRAEFFGQSSADTLPDVLGWIDARAILIHRDSLSAVQLRAVQYVLQENLGLTTRRDTDTLLYIVPKSLKGDGVFLARDEGWQHVGYDAKRQATFAEIERSAFVTLYNVTGEATIIELSFTVPPESRGSLVVRRGDEVVLEVLEAPTDRIELRLELEPGSAELEFVNRLPDNMIIQDSLLRVIGAR